MIDIRRALIVGVNEARGASPLTGCARDATKLSTLLARNDDNSPNFHCTLLADLSDAQQPTKQNLRREVEELFEGEAQCVLFYFAGHAVLDPEGAPVLMTSDAASPEDGVPLDHILRRANRMNRAINSTVIIIDSCVAGGVGERSRDVGTPSPSEIGHGVTILTASARRAAARETQDGGVFTGYMLDALAGTAADLRGHVTPAAIYAHIDRMLGPKGQRPVYKANVQRFISLRKCTPRIDLGILQRLPDLFPDPDGVFELDPSYEPDRENVPERYRHLPVDPKNVAKFKMLQACNRQGLVEPVGAAHMYDAAIGSKSCRLTQLGEHYRDLAERGWL